MNHRHKMLLNSWASRRSKVFAALQGVTKEMDLLDEAMQKHDTFKYHKLNIKLEKLIRLYVK